MKKKLFYILLLLIVVVFGIYKYMYKSHRDIATEDAAFSKTVSEVFQAFTTNDSLANKTYLDKTISVKGKITNIDLSSKIITVDEKLSARFTNKISDNIKLQDSITLKGRLVGYDDLLEEIQMDQCTIE
ncbi:MAG: hypothetical protein V4535_03320 [Bacteroidota bacterium]